MEGGGEEWRVEGEGGGGWREVEGGGRWREVEGGGGRGDGGKMSDAVFKPFADSSRQYNQHVLQLQVHIVKPCGRQINSLYGRTSCENIVMLVSCVLLLQFQE